MVPAGMAPCPVCHGRGEWLIANTDPQRESDSSCITCDGRGYLTVEQAAEFRRQPAQAVPNAR